MGEEKIVTKESDLSDENGVTSSLPVPGPWTEEDEANARRIELEFHILSSKIAWGLKTPGFRKRFARKYPEFYAALEVAWASM